ncbi:putative tetratricopeptide-like helical domain superfamily [Dioscorea sansibarensis]
MHRFKPIKKRPTVPPVANCQNCHHNCHSTPTCRAFNSQLSDPPNSSWLPSIRSASQLGRFTHALALYARMHRSGHHPDPFSISAALKACARIPSRPSATAIHAHTFKYGHHSHHYPQTALLDLYSKLDGLESARKLFDEMPQRNVVSWNTMLSAYVRAGELASARRVFEEMPVKDVVSWNSLVSGYAKAGLMDQSLDLFRRMPERNSASWNGIISAYVDVGDMGMARKVFDKMPVKSSVSWIAMISGYSQSGDVDFARELFDKMEEREVFAWNAMIACYAQNGCPRDALVLFNRMNKPETNVQPDEMTFSSAISACAQLSDMRFGLWIESHMACVGVEMDDHLGTALIDLYSKCGGVEKAFELFNGLRKRDLVSYSAMILGCGINGRSTDAMSLFDEMLREKIVPNSVTFVGLLAAFKHAGLLQEAHQCFGTMWSEHKVKPSGDHYAIMVDLLGQSGSVEEAYLLIKEMPMKPHVGVWGALLQACRLHGNVELGEIAARSCFELEPESSGYYILLAHIYAEAGEWEKAKRLRMAIADKKGFICKAPGCSWV